MSTVRLAAWAVRALIGALAVGLACAGGCRRADDGGGAVAETTASAAASYVGRDACVSCHREEVERYTGSHHDLAMQLPTSETVLGDFRDASFTYNGVTSRFSVRDGRFIVRTDGKDGQLRDFEVAYVFGVYPLQQYLVAFPDGRYQALSIAWDARPKAAGGQRWYHLYPDEQVDHADVLHWTTFGQNWNAQCATCHSTNLRKNYDREADTYKTTFSEIDVSCEACHGPASRHVAWARGAPASPASGRSAADMGLTASLRERRGVQWTMQMPRGIASRAPAPQASRAEVEVCAPCHARRAERFDAHVPGERLLMSYRPSLLSEGLYRADGQMQDEVYTYGSFVQSRMYAAGVTCSDCHDPHSQTLRAEGNAVCAQCHLPSVFDVRAHHGHEVGTPGASCVACHMPVETYMGVDRRHDHGFKVPRPDLSAQTGAPDTCTTCHRGRTPAWAAAALDRWRTPAWRTRPETGTVVAAARAGRASAAPAVTALATDAAYPGIVRASAIELLATLPVASLEATLTTAAADADPLVRSAVAQVLPSLDPAARARVGARLLEDPLRTVRVDAATALDGEPSQWLTAPQREALARGLADARASDLFNGDRPESAVNLALRAERQGDVATARREYERSIARLPWFMPAYVNLAELQRHGGDEVGAEATLRRALIVVPEEPSVLYALGLSLYRQGRAEESTQALARAAAAAPQVARYAFAHALGLDAQRRPAAALAVIDAARQRHPEDRDLLDAGLSIARTSGDTARARRYLQGLLTLTPGDPQLEQLQRALGGG